MHRRNLVARCACTYLSTYPYCSQAGSCREHLARARYGAGLDLGDARGAELLGEADELRGGKVLYERGRIDTDVLERRRLVCCHTGRRGRSARAGGAGRSGGIACRRYGPGIPSGYRCGLCGRVSPEHVHKRPYLERVREPDVRPCTDEDKEYDAERDEKASEESFH